MLKQIHGALKKTCGNEKKYVYSSTRLKRHRVMRHLLYIVTYSVVPVHS